MILIRHLLYVVSVPMDVAMRHLAWVHSSAEDHNHFQRDRHSAANEAFGQPTWSELTAMFRRSENRVVKQRQKKKEASDTHSIEEGSGDHGVFKFRKEGEPELPASNHGQFEFVDGVIVPWMQLWPPPLSATLTDSVLEHVGQRQLFVFHHAMFGSAGSDNSKQWQLGLKNGLVSLSFENPKKIAPKVVLYSARGCGDFHCNGKDKLKSQGWQGRGVAQLGYKSQGLDLHDFAAAMDQQKPCILGGSSAGAGAAMWAATMSPRSISGLVLHNVPPVWDTDAKWRKDQVSQSEEDAAKNNSNKANYLKAQALTDVPSKEELAMITVPVLIVNCREDVTHPAEAAAAVANVLPSVTLVIVETQKELPDAFANALGKWLADVVPSTHP